MTIEINIQNQIDSNNLPSDEQFQSWVEEVLKDRQDSGELTIRFVDSDESAELNKEYRDKSGPTNVLAFPCDIPMMVEPPLLGDLVICVPVVELEARDQDKSFEAHVAHMVVHGTLHLLGFDHQNDQEADEMESIESGILQRLGFKDPYIVSS